MSAVGRVQRVAAYNVCIDAAGRLLLCRLSAVTEAPGAWTLPGGGIDFGEHPERAALRELEEETGLIGEIAELLAVDSVHRPVRLGEDAADYHSIRIVYRTAIVGGDLRHEVAGSTDRAEWHTRAELETLPLVATSELGMRLVYGRAS
jgi:ADP-ribose pyrophosphatase YjhB (NUDIX family)